MRELILSPDLTRELMAIHRTLQDEYDRTAKKIPLTCQGCPDNCCDSWFFHHTYGEWAFLWQGLRRLGKSELAQIVGRAEEWIRQSERQLAAGQRPQLMCPLNEDGLCRLYEHRLLVCRMHGIPATLTRPDGQSLRFPGCFRCQELVGKQWLSEHEAPAMDRTWLFTRLAALEARVLEDCPQRPPKTKKTIAEMIAQGPPVISESLGPLQQS